MDRQRNDSEDVMGEKAAYCLRGELDGEPRTFDLLKGWNVLGASRSCDVVTAVKGVSRRHARLFVGEDGVRVEDLQSRNGTRVGGRRVDGAELRPGDRLSLGPVELRLETRDPEDGALGLVLDAEPASLGAADPTSLHGETSLRGETRIDAARLGTITAMVDYLALPQPDVSAALESLVASTGATGALWIEGRGPDKIVAGSVGPLPEPLPEADPRAGEDLDDGWALHREPGRLGVVHTGRRDVDAALWLSLPEAKAGPETLTPWILTGAKILFRLARAPAEALAEPTPVETGLVFPDGILPGRSPAMKALYQRMRPLVDGDLPVLILGETGVGKEHLAHAFHLSSRRAGGPFVALNCAAIPEQLLEAELFGIGRGVATGVDARQGTFVAASGGTLFLDEIGDMPPPLQAKLLRVLQDGRVHPLGRPPQQVDVRVVAATHTDLDAAMADGRFRRDLYFRLAGFELEVPPLRRRREDLSALLAFFLRRFADQTGKRIPGLSLKALRAFMAYDWPGNIRELEHEVRRCVYAVPSGQAVDSSLLSSRVLGGAAPPDDDAELGDEGLSEQLAALEERLIRRALSQVAGNQTRAAEALQISRGGLIKRMKRLGIDSSEL